MSRITVLADFEGDLKALKKSTKLMRNPDFRSLVQIVEKFHRDVKLSSLTIRERTQLIHLGEDAQFYRILVKMLREVTGTTGTKQREDLKKVVQWYQTNKEVLHGHPHFKGATKELYKKPGLSFSKDAIKHYSLPKENRKKKSVTIATGQRSKSATVIREKPHGSKKDGGQEGGGRGGGGGWTGVHGARPLTAPPAPGLHRPKISNSLSSSSNSGANKPILEENSFMVNYVNNKLAKYDNYDPSLARPSSAIGMAKAVSELSVDSSRADTESQIQTPRASLESISTTNQQPPHPQDSQENLSIADSEMTFTPKQDNVELDERGLPKVVYPFLSLKSPFGQEDIIEEEAYHGGQSPDKRNKSPLKLKVNVPVAGNDDTSPMTEEELKAANLQKWQEFKDRQAFEQELASKQAFFGRGGDPTGVRYEVHDGGEMPEYYTQDIIAGYVEEEGLVHYQAQTGDAYHSQELQDFYLSTEKYSPPVRPASSLSTGSPREGVTPAQSLNDVMMSDDDIARGVVPNEAGDYLQERPPNSHEQEKPTKHSVHFESVVDLAGPVCDSMTMHKEMLSPEPQLGYRQPALAIAVKPPPTMNNINLPIDEKDEYYTSPPLSPSSPSASQSHQSQSIYKMAGDEDGMVPPNSSRFSGSSKSMTSEYTQRNRRGEPIILLPEESDYNVHFRRRQRPSTANPIIPHAISSRQITQIHSSPPKYKWGIESLPEQEPANNKFSSRTKSAPSRWSLRSAGSTSGGRRPRTAIDVSMKQRWNLNHDNDDNQRVPQAASHSSTTVAPKALASMMVVSHLGGDNRRARSRMGYRGLKGYDENLPGFLPDMQFLSITGPARIQARGHDDIVEQAENLPSPNESNTPSENENASTHPQLDNLPSQHWTGLSMSSDNPEQLSDPFSKKGEADSLAGGDASDRSSMMSGAESDRMKDLDEDMDSDGGFPDEGDTPRTIDADLDDELEAVGEVGTPRSTTSGEAQGEREDDNTIRTIDVDMRSVSQINTDHDDGQSVIESQISDKCSVKSFDDHNHKKVADQVTENGEGVTVAEDTKGQTVEAEQTDLSETLEAPEITKEQPAPEQSPDVTRPPGDLAEDQSLEKSVSQIIPVSSQELFNEEEDASIDGSNSEDLRMEKDILTGSQKADLLSRSFLAVTRHRTVERPSSAHSRLCPTHKLLAEEQNQSQEKGRASSPLEMMRRMERLKSPSADSVRSLPVGLTYMPLAEDHITQLEKEVPLLDDSPGFPMMPYVAKKHLTPRSTPNASPRSTPISFSGSPQDSRESFGGSPKSSRSNSPQSTNHFRPIMAERGERLTPPHILVRRPTSAPSIRSPRHEANDDDHDAKKPAPQRPISARHRSVSPQPPSSPRPISARSPGWLSQHSDADNKRSLSPSGGSSRPTSARRPRSASPRSPTSTRPTSPMELRVSSPVPQRPSSPRGRAGPEWTGRPLNVYGVKDRHLEEEENRRQQEAKTNVIIQNWFSKSSSKQHKRKLNKMEKERNEKKRKEDLERLRNYNEHIWKRDMALIKHEGYMDKSWERDYMIDKLMRDRMRQEKWTAMKQQQAMENRKAQSYLKRIGPSVDIWDFFHGEKRGISKAQFKKAAVILQKYVRGWIVRSMLKKVVKKSRVHAASFKSFVQYYNKVLKRIAIWHGAKKPRIHADLWQMDEFMDRKRYYESVFVNRTHPGDEMVVKEIDLFFKECDHYPSKREVYNAILGATKKDPDKPHLKLKEKDVVETAFMIYVPDGTGLKTEKLRSSTWLNPLVEGEEARKLMGSEHVEPTSYLTSIQVVAAAFNERKEKQLDEIKRQAKKSEEAAKKSAQEQQQ